MSNAIHDSHFISHFTQLTKHVTLFISNSTLGTKQNCPLSSEHADKFPRSFFYFFRTIWSCIPSQILHSTLQTNLSSFIRTLACPLITCWNINQSVHLLPAGTAGAHLSRYFNNLWWYSNVFNYSNILPVAHESPRNGGLYICMECENKKCAFLHLGRVFHTLSAWHRLCEIPK